MLDQEISLFYDECPVLPMAELKIALPQSDGLWLHNNASTFQQAYDKAYGSRQEDSQSRKDMRHSLHDLFRLLLDDRVDQWDQNLEILHMRLLLYPIQTMVCQLSQLVVCLPSTWPTNRFSRNPCETSSAFQLEEIKKLLKRWFEKFTCLEPQTTRHSALKKASLIIYHLISLNLCLSIPEIERIAREELSPGTTPGSNSVISDLFDKCIYVRQEALLHCGQVLRLLRDMHVQLRPLWSPLAIYRATVALWAISISLASTGAWSATDFSASRHLSSSRNPGTVAAIDTLRETALRQFFKHNRGGLCLTTETGQLVPLDDTNGILNICTQILCTEQPMCQLAEGVAQKVQSLWVPMR